MTTWSVCARMHGRTNDVEPAALRKARLRAVRTLNPNDQKEITWADYRRSYTILTTWWEKGRIDYSVWARLLALHK